MGTQYDLLFEARNTSLRSLGNWISAQIPGGASFSPDAMGNLMMPVPPYVMALRESGEWKPQRPEFSHHLTLAVPLESDTERALETALSLLGVLGQRHSAQLIYNKEFVLATVDQGAGDVTFVKPTFVADVLKEKNLFDFAVALERNDFKLRPLGIDFAET